MYAPAVPTIEEGVNMMALKAICSNSQLTSRVYTVDKETENLLN